MPAWFEPAARFFIVTQYAKFCEGVDYTLKGDLQQNFMTLACAPYKSFRFYS